MACVVNWWYDGVAKDRKHDNIKSISAERWKEIQKKFPHVPICKDMTWARREALVRLPRFAEDWLVENLLEDPRDVIMVSTLMNLFVFITFAVVSLFVYPSHILGAVLMFVNVFFFIERFILMLHYAAHRRLFKKEHTVLNKIMPYVVAPFFGIPIAMYETHHLVMHHTENNLFPGDLSSTEPYRRDSFRHWLCYVAKYWQCITQLPLYAWRKGRMDRFLEIAVGEPLWILTMVYLWKYGYGLQSFWLMLLPTLIASMAMMFGNFSQHILIDPRISSYAVTPGNKASYKYNCALAINVINTHENLYSFNDGYHINHHVNSRLHWTELPWHFYENIEKFAEHDPMVFEGLSFMDVGIHIMAGMHRKLFQHYVHLTPEKISFEEFMTKLDDRVQPIDQTQRKLKGAVDTKVGQK